jgi:sugar-specific transcriptional regulator TrmB
MRMHYPPEALEGLEAFGLDSKEATIYLAGLELGTATVLELSRRTQMPRTTLYPLLEKLRRIGVFRRGKEKKRIVYTPEPPGQLEQQMTERQDKLSKSLSSLEVLQETAMGGPGVTFFEGSEGFKKLWRHIYASGVTEYRLITSGVGLLDYVKEPYLVDRVIAERKRKGIKSMQLIPENRETKKIVERDKSELRESRFMPADVDLPSSVIIFADQVAFITTRRENTMIIVASGDVARTYKTLFDLVWNCASTHID